MRKRVLAALLCGVMTLGLLTSCGGASTDTDDAGGTETSSTTDAGEYPTIVMVMMNSSGALAGQARISERISEITREQYGVNVDLEFIDASSYKQQLQLMLASGEQVDIFNGVYLGYTACVNNGYLLDLEQDDLIATYGQGILDTMGETYIDACRVEGRLYGLPQKKDNARGFYGFAIGKEYLEAIGYDYESMYANEGDEVIHTDMATINDIFAQLHEQYPDKYVILPDANIVNQGPLIDSIGGDLFGVTVDPANSLEIVDFFQTEEFRELCDRYYTWNQAGYISQDALTDDTSASDAVKSGATLALTTNVAPGIKQGITSQVGREVIIFQTGENLVVSSAIYRMPWCINSNTEYAKEAMQVLNGFYTDPALSNLIGWGEEGVEYKKTDDGHITFADGVNADNSEYYHSVNWETPNQFISYVWEGKELDIWEQTEDFNNNALISKALGFTFDNSEVASEYTALTNVYNEYVKSLVMGFTEPESGIAEMEEKLQAAGLADYMAAKQTALDAWAATK